MKETPGDQDLPLLVAGDLAQHQTLEHDADHADAGPATATSQKSAARQQL
jgi:hypothetical protein